jgi:hypothetical protein
LVLAGQLGVGFRLRLQPQFQLLDGLQEVIFDEVLQIFYLLLQELTLASTALLANTLTLTLFLRGTDCLFAVELDDFAEFTVFVFEEKQLVADLAVFLLDSKNLLLESIDLDAVGVLESDSTNSHLLLACP